MFERSAEKQEKSQFPALIVDTSNPLPFLSFFFFKDAILTWDLGKKKQTKKKKKHLNTSTEISDTDPFKDKAAWSSSTGWWLNSQGLDMDTTACKLCLLFPHF